MKMKVRKAVAEYDSGRRGDDFIRYFATGFGLDYEPLSELGNTSSAVRGFDIFIAIISACALTIVTSLADSVPLFSGILTLTGSR